MKTDSRFYLPDGSTVAGLREARKIDGAVPSVTTVTAIYPKPWLARWKLDQVLHAALTLPQQPGETLDGFAARVQDDAEAQAAHARDLGSRAHDAILQFGGVTPDIAPVFECWRNWQPAEKTVWTERVLFGPDYAGRADRLQLGDGGYFLDDFKIRSKARTYDEDCIQLAAYLEALPIEQWVYARCRSIVVQADGSTILVREWSDTELAEAYDTFRKLHTIWCRVNNFFPSRSEHSPVRPVNSSLPQLV